ncbi:hypothetical protein F5Y10DRAFT_105625 [Nemania abortiva]|nr:hypothetical protein F5Y10DRAFT_105625 [Nemania abortiva]
MPEDDATGQEVRRPSSVVAPSEHGLDEKPALKSSELGAGAHYDQAFRSKNEVDGSKQEALPYMIQEEGAYRLPISLLSVHKDNDSVPSKHSLAMDLAPLSPG